MMYFCFDTRYCSKLKFLTYHTTTWLDFILLNSRASFSILYNLQHFSKIELNKCWMLHIRNMRHRHTRATSIFSTIKMCPLFSNIVSSEGVKDTWYPCWVAMGYYWPIMSFICWIKTCLSFTGSVHAIDNLFIANRRDLKILSLVN